MKEERLELEGKSVLVLGLGITGRSAARFCAERGARVVAADERSAAELGEVDVPTGVDVRAGEHFPDPEGFDLVVPSPGVPRERYAARARSVWGDLELVFRALPVPIVAITGTNGKSTTTLLVEALLRSAGVRARAAGNVGEPALELVGGALDVAVLEVSSFQLEATERFRPRVAVVLNATPDHLDRHGSFEAYVEAKARILANQEPGDAAVLNADDPAVAALAERTRADVFFFRSSGPVERGAWLDAGAAVLRLRDGDPVRVPLDAFALPGIHNRENALAALLAVAAVGADPTAAAPALATFRGLPHRCEIVETRGGITFVNDSKATNPGAALHSLSGFDAPVIWLAGGRDKGLDFSALADIAKTRARAAIVYGESASKLGDALSGGLEVHAVDSLDAAVAEARRLARTGDVVLLAPACASQDQFRDFEERGERFRAAVLALPGEAR